MFVTQYNHSLVFLSLMVAICAAYVALGVAERICDSRGRIRTLSIWVGAFTMGVAIWSMHYVGMLALSLPITVRYDVPLVLLSIAVAIFASAVAFILTGQRQLRKVRLLLGSLAMGGGIAIMHYLGMAAMRMQCVISWNWSIVALSVLIAISVSACALASFRFSPGLTGPYKVIAASLLGAAISSMHYVGMAAAHFVRSTEVPDLRGTLSVSVLGAAGIGTVSLAILGLAGGGSVVGKFINQQSMRLESSEERYRLLFEKCLLGVYRVGLDGLILDINQAGVNLLGYSKREELIGTNLIGEHLSGVDGRLFSDLISRRLDLPPQETELIKKDGEKTFVLHSATTIETSHSAPGEVQGFFLSIADLKWTENELRRSQVLAEAGNAAKRHFMTRMSHELRTPLNGILGMTDILFHSPLSEQQRECVSLARQSGEELLQSIDQILTYADESSPKPESRWEEFALRDLINEEIQVVALRAQRRGLTIQSDIADDCADVFYSDTTRLRHILAALLSNAIKFTPAGTIDVCARTRPSIVGAYPIVTLAVSDTGVGIAREMQDNIFEPFPGLDGSDLHGTGLGLATVKSAVSALHGTITLESETGKGSTFSVELPMRPVASRLSTNLI